MKIRYIVSMSGATATFPAFEKDYKGDYVFYDLDDYEAVRLIDAEMCVAKNEKDYIKAKENYESLKAENERKKIIAEKINKLGEMKEKRDSLKNELDELEKEINLIENAVNQEKE